MLTTQCKELIGLIFVLTLEVYCYQLFLSITYDIELVLDEAKDIQYIVV